MVTVIERNLIMATYLIVSVVTLVGAFIVGALIYLLVMSSGLKRACRDLESSLESLYREVAEKEVRLKKDIEDLERDNEGALNAVYQEIETKVQTLVNQHEKAISDIDRRIEESFSHADSRFDQLLNKVEKEYVRKS
jgi:DNA anti-recombination protein RmuC